MLRSGWSRRQDTCGRCAKRSTSVSVIHSVVGSFRYTGCGSGAGGAAGQGARWCQRQRRRSRAGQWGPRGCRSSRQCRCCRRRQRRQCWWGASARARCAAGWGAWRGGCQWRWRRRPRGQRGRTAAGPCASVVGAGGGSGGGAARPQVALAAGRAAAAVPGGAGQQPPAAGRGERWQQRRRRGRCRCGWAGRQACGGNARCGMRVLRRWLALRRHPSCCWVPRLALIVIAAGGASVVQREACGVGPHRRSRPRILGLAIKLE